MKFQQPIIIHFCTFICLQPWVVIESIYKKLRTNKIVLKRRKVIWLPASSFSHKYFICRLILIICGQHFPSNEISFDLQFWDSITNLWTKSVVFHRQLILFNSGLWFGLKCVLNLVANNIYFFSLSFEYISDPRC